MIPEEYAANLFDRFNYDNAVDVCDKKLIDVPCEICEDYHGNNCIKCPLDKYKTSNLRGCSALLEDIYPYYWVSIKILITSVSWYVTDDEDAKIILDKITKRLRDVS